MPSSGAPALIPNGQPPQWNRPPVMPHAVKVRPPPAGSNVTSSVSNGTPTPSNCSHPGTMNFTVKSCQIHHTYSCKCNRDVYNLLN